MQGTTIVKLFNYNTAKKYPKKDSKHQKNSKFRDFKIPEKSHIRPKISKGDPLGSPNAFSEPETTEAQKGVPIVGNEKIGKIAQHGKKGNL